MHVAFWTHMRGSPDAGTDAMLRVSVGQVVNHLRGSLAVRRRPRRVGSTPRFLQVEVSSRCNLRCSHCLRPRLSSAREPGDMTLETFARIQEELPRLDVLTVHGLGEPLLNSALPEMVRSYCAANPFTRIGMSTNGVMLEGDVLAEVMSCGFYEVGISLDAARSETFELVRGSRDFDRVVGNMTELVRRRTGSQPRVVAAFVVMRENWREMTEFVRLGAKIGVDQVSLCDLNLQWAPEHAWPDEESIGFPKEWAAAREAASSLGTELTYARFDRTLWGPRLRCRPCFYLWDMPYITWNGYVTPCCALPDPGVINFGNVLETPFRNIWNSAQYRDYREAVTSRDTPEPCIGCHHLC